MKVLLVNKFLYPKGGDAITTIDTGRLLEKRGHDVIFWGMEHPLNPDYKYKEYFAEHIDFNKPAGLFEKIKMAETILYSWEAKRKLEALLRNVKIDIAHLNNFAHQLSPSILHALKKHKIPVVMTMHDYKLVCASYTLVPMGKECDLCRNGRYYYCLKEKCVKGSRVKSLINTVEMYLHHNILKIYGLIDIYISPSRFMREKLIDMGFKRQIEVLPNFVDIGNFKPSFDAEEKSVCYVGRVSPEKGLITLVHAMKGIDLELKIIGDGEFQDTLKAEAEKIGMNNIRFLGFLNTEELKKEIAKSMFMVLTSECYENNPRCVIEAFSLGKPVVGSRIGGIPELVKDGITGYTFNAGDQNDLHDKIKQLAAQVSKRIEMGKNARKFIEDEFSPDVYYKRLMEIYKKAL